MLIFKETFVFEIELTHLFLKVTGFFLNKTELSWPGNYQQT